MRAVGVNRFSRAFEHRGIASAVTADRVWSVLIGFHRPGARGGAEVWRRKTPSPIVFDDFIALAFQRGIGATRPTGGSVGPSEGRATDTRGRGG